MKYFIVLLITIGMASSAFAASVTLKWNEGPESDLAGYRIHSGSQSGVYDSSVDVQLTETPLTPMSIQTIVTPECGENPTRFYALTAYDTAGNESGFSSEKSVMVDIKPCAPVFQEILAVLERIETLVKNAKVTFGE